MTFAADTHDLFDIDKLFIAFCFTLPVNLLFGNRKIWLFTLWEKNRLADKPALVVPTFSIFCFYDYIHTRKVPGCRLQNSYIGQKWSQKLWALFQGKNLYLTCAAVGVVVFVVNYFTYALFFIFVVMVLIQHVVFPALPELLLR